jgi:hypothetical protein
MKIQKTIAAFLALAGTIASARYAEMLESNFVEANFTQLIDHFAIPADPRTF